MAAVLSILMLGLGLGMGVARAQVYDATLGFGGSEGDLGCMFGSLKGSRFPRKIYDPHTGERIMMNISACTGGYVLGTNLTTGAHWNADLFDDGSARGRDLDGDTWRFDPKARLFVNLTTKATCAHTDLRHVCEAKAAG